MFFVTLRIAQRVWLSLGCQNFGVFALDIADKPVVRIIVGG